MTTGSTEYASTLFPTRDSRNQAMVLDFITGCTGDTDEALRFFTEDFEDALELVCDMRRSEWLEDADTDAEMQEAVEKIRLRVHK